MNVTTRTLLVGVDRSEESDAALEWAQALAGPTDRIVVLHTWHLPVVSAYDALAMIDPADAEQLAEQALDELIKRTGDDRLVPVTRPGHAGKELVEEAEHQNADLIVVGHRGNGRLSLMLGSTANYVVHHTTRPIVVVRGDAVGPPRHVVVGVDDHGDDPDVAEKDAASVRALRWAIDLPGVERVDALHAWFLPPLLIGTFPTVTDDLDTMDASAQEVAERAVASAGRPPDGVDVVATTARGTGGFALIEASREADLVVVGRRGRSGFAELVLGSTSAMVAAHAHAPVAIIS